MAQSSVIPGARAIPRQGSNSRATLSQQPTSRPLASDREGVGDARRSRFVDIRNGPPRNDVEPRSTPKIATVAHVLVLTLVFPSPRRLCISSYARRVRRRHSTAKGCGCDELLPLMTEHVLQAPASITMRVLYKTPNTLVCHLRRAKEGKE